AGAEDEAPGGERIRAKGELSRRRTIIQEENGAAGAMPTIDATVCKPGRVLRVHGLHSVVETEDGKQFRCTVRRVLRTLVTEERNIVSAGDRVWILPGQADEGVIERVEPRYGLLTRASRGREHVLVANVDQVVIVMSLAEPDLKPHLLDRYLASAEQGSIAAVICLDKADLVDLVPYQPL